MNVEPTTATLPMPPNGWARYRLRARAGGYCWGPWFPRGPTETLPASAQVGAPQPGDEVLIWWPLRPPVPGVERYRYQPEAT